MTNSNHRRIGTLRSILDRFAENANSNTTDIERALVECWLDFDGHGENGMAGHKLIGRMEKIESHSPILSFTIERHGGTVLGSTRTELHRWTVDLDELTADCTVVGQRTVGLVSTAVRQSELQLVALEIVELVRNGATDPRLIWKDSGTVHVVIEQIIPSTGFTRTIQGRRKRLRQILEEALAKDGWVHVGRNVLSVQSPKT